MSTECISRSLYKPRSFISHAFFSLAEELEQRRSNDSAIEQIIKEPLLGLKLLLLGAPFVVAYWLELMAHELVNTINDILVVGISQLMRLEQQ